MLFLLPSVCSALDPVNGGSLYLMQHGTEALRAEFTRAKDCEIVAITMNMADPESRWRCATSTAPRNFRCSLTGTTIKNWDQKTAEEINLQFRLSLHRGEAKATGLGIAATYFDYTQTGNAIKLKNNYPLVEDNYYGNAVTYINIDAKTGAATILAYDQKENGRGQCELQK